MVLSNWSNIPTEIICFSLFYSHNRSINNKQNLFLPECFESTEWHNLHDAIDSEHITDNADSVDVFAWYLRSDNDNVVIWQNLQSSPSATSEGSRNDRTSRGTWFENTSVQWPTRFDHYSTSDQEDHIENRSV